ncbi:TPA: hypothetical protein ACS7XC_001543 [Providencia alcalifaciens]|uniref:hypothetical protein n=1 Tax=Providencia alcalifaciens TaxID=126385 RepID=UPI0015CFDFD0|nr:hypothetical protein [Providencia alcalifaciens]MBF0690614.1 hypothetical protein [Providencia alcalifaciens]NYS89118.1 hypothetical protein [Providencia alcalifaciens]
MRSGSRDIYGVNVLPLIAIIYQLRRRRAIWNLRRRWNNYRRDLMLCKQYHHLSHHTEYFDVQQRYERMRLYVKAYQQRGDI